MSDRHSPGGPIVPRGHALRSAVAWLAEQHGWSHARIEEACQRFDLCPADEEFLIDAYHRMHDTCPDCGTAAASRKS